MASSTLPHLVSNEQKFKVIETSYNNYRFRSRLEARWAKYFDAMSFAYFYEHEGFDLDEAGWYLPDFYLPHVGMWAEVKPTTFNDEELAKLKALVTFTQKPALMLIGVPDRQAYEAWCFDAHSRPNGLYLCTFALSNHHNYYQEERRFYGGLYDGEILADYFDDVDDGILAARSARF